MFESPITPTVGRIVLVRGPGVLPGEPMRELPAIVTRVWGQNCINATVFNDSHVQQVSSIMFGSDLENVSGYANWRWMDYQVSVAAKREAEEAVVSV
jgi:hypothetical protein